MAARLTRARSEMGDAVGAVGAEAAEVRGMLERVIPPLLPPLIPPLIPSLIPPLIPPLIIPPLGAGEAVCEAGRGSRADSERWGAGAGRAGGEDGEAGREGGEGERRGETAGT